MSRERELAGLRGGAQAGAGLGLSQIAAAVRKVEERGVKDSTGRKIGRLVGVCVGVALVAACGGGAGQASPSSAGPKPLKVALIMPDQINDQSYGQGAYTALVTLQKEGLIQFAYTVNTAEDAATVTQLLTGYANQGYGLIIAHSFNYGAVLLKVAPQFPNIMFAWNGNGNDTGLPPNVADYAPPIWQSSYLAGILAGGATTSGIFGEQAGFNYPVCAAMLNEFTAGAQTVRPNVRALVTYIGTWTDVQQSQAAAAAQADAGADVFLSCGETRGPVQVALQRNLTAIGYIESMFSLAPKNILTSNVWDLSAVFKTIVEKIDSGGAAGGFYNLGVKEGALLAPINSGYKTPIPAAVMSKYTQTLANIKNGTFVVPCMGAC